MGVLIAIFLGTMALLALTIAVAQRSPRHRLLHRAGDSHGDVSWTGVGGTDAGCADGGGGSDGGGGGGGCD